MQFLDTQTRNQLGFDQVWSRLEPVSPLGRARQRRAVAFAPEDREGLQAELERVEQICLALQSDPKAADGLRYLLGMVRDIRGCLERSRQGSVLDDVEFYAIKKLLLIVEQIQTELERLGWEFLPSLDLVLECRQALSAGQGREDSFYLADAYDEELARIRRERVRLEGIIADFRRSVENKILQSVGRTLTMDGNIAVSRTDRDALRQLEAIEELEQVRTTPDALTFALVEDAGMQQIRRDLRQSREEEEACKQAIRVRLTECVAALAPRILSVLERLGYLDLLLAKGKLSFAMGGIRPSLCQDSCLRIKNGRHPLLEEEVEQRGYTYTPLCVNVCRGVTIITGPNMGGKTASLKMIGLLAALAQHGLLVPAASMEFSPRRFIRAHLTAAQIPRGLSAFAGEIAFLGRALEQGHGEGLILVDEIAHGTGPAEGAAIAQAIAEELNRQSSITVITTHYPSLACMEGVVHLRVRGLGSDPLQQGDLHTLQRRMDYRLEETGPQGAIWSSAALVAEAMGLDRKVIARARELQEKRDTT
ncbi:MAG: hypothetical protein QM451_13285 [Bacillota bacterium]|jgi:dsDNA-specific endonuclease/ATPase MutS2|nr:hypothetical protein [Bacillota bacterium]HHT89805.1 hypothetical protein [Bacillota bacterium]